jgi:hypothetical protein
MCEDLTKFCFDNKYRVRNEKWRIRVKKTWTRMADFCEASEVIRLARDG